MTEKIPFMLNEEIPLIAVRVFLNARGPFNFVLDTGASMTIASPTTARRAGLQLREAESAHSLGIDGKQEIRIVKAKYLCLGAAAASNLDIGVCSLRPIARGTQMKLEGILGYNFLRYFNISIHYADRFLTLCRNDDPRLETASRMPELSWK